MAAFDYPIAAVEAFVGAQLCWTGIEFSNGEKDHEFGACTKVETASGLTELQQVSNSQSGRPGRAQVKFKAAQFLEHETQ